MGKFMYAVVLAGGLAAGFVGGKYCATDVEYKINRDNEIVMLESKSLNKSHELKKLNEDFYLGDSNHNLKGVQVLAMYEAGNMMESKVDSLEQELDKFNLKEKAKDLTNRVKDGLSKLQENVKK